MDMFWGHMVILQCKFEYGTKFNGHSPTPAYCHFLNLFRQFLTILNSSNYQWTTKAGVIKSEIQFLRPKKWPFCPKCYRAGFWPENPFFCNITLDFVNGPFVGLDDIFDLAPSDRFLNFSFPSYRVSPSGLRPKNLIFLRYTHITPIFWGQTDPTQRDLKSPIS